MDLDCRGNRTDCRIWSFAHGRNQLFAEYPHVYCCVTVLGVSMMEEDILIQKYDTPHEEDTHPPQLIMLRMVRGIVLIVLGTLFFVLAF